MTAPRGRGGVRPVAARPGSALAMTLALAAGLVGCTDDADPSPPGTAGSPSPTASEVAAGPVQRPLVAREDPRPALTQDLLDARAAAVRAGDLDAFVATLAPARLTDKGFRAQQKRWFRNLQQLPVGRLAYTVRDNTVQQTGFEVDRDAPGVYVPYVQTTLRLRGFDDAPVSRNGAVTVARTPRGYRVVSVDDADELLDAGDAAIGRAPWDLTALDVRRQRGGGSDTLLLLDDGSAAQGDTLLALLGAASTRVRDAVPFPWDGSVVAYATGDDKVIGAIRDVPGGDVANVGALAFPIYEEPNRGAVAAFRFALNPAVLTSDDLFLRRLVTHELTHVALGVRDDGAPTWISEGAAEYVGALGLAPTETRIAVAAVDRARSIRQRLDAGRPVELRMPPTDTFNSGDSDWHYGLSWYAMEWIAANRGQSSVWRLVRAMARGDGTPDDRQDRVLRKVIGVGEAELVSNAIDLILDTYDR